jgi:hypothetical protein
MTDVGARPQQRAAAGDANMLYAHHDSHAPTLMRAAKACAAEHGESLKDLVNRAGR